MYTARILAALVVFGVAPCFAARQGATLGEARRQTGEPAAPAVSVGGRTLSGPFSLAQRRGSRLFLPVGAIARALGDTLDVDLVSRTVEVRRSTGTTAEFDAATRQVRESGATVLVVGDTSDVPLVASAQELMLPVEIVAALFDVFVVYDETARVVRVLRDDATATGPRTGAQHGLWEMMKADYQYRLRLQGESWTQGLGISTGGRLGRGRFLSRMNFVGGGGGRPLELDGGRFHYEGPGGETLIAGDFGAGADVPFLSSQARGALFQRPVGPVRVTAFAGMALSASFGAESDLDDGLDALAPRDVGYDTTLFGSYVTLGSASNGATSSTEASIGASAFRGPERSGELVAATVRHATSRLQAELNTAFGSFEGLQEPGRAVDGVAGAVEFAGSFRATSELVLQGRLTHIGEGFLSAQPNGLFRPVSGAALGVTWLPADWLSAAVTATSRKFLLSDTATRSASVTVVTAQKGIAPATFVSYTRERDDLQGGGARLFAVARREFETWRLFGQFTSVTAGSGDRRRSSRIGAIGASLQAPGGATLTLQQTVSGRGSFGGSADYSTIPLLGGRALVGGGLEYRRSRSAFSLVPRLQFAARLPGRQAISLSYVQTQRGPSIFVTLGGALLARGGEAMLSRSAGEIASYGAYYGRVYDDVDLDGAFNPVVDRPLGGITLRVDSFSVVTDQNGLYRVDDVPLGEHLVGLDLASVRADLAILGSARQIAVLGSGRDTIVDFRLARSGRLSGMVWLDANGNGALDAEERPVADARIFIGNARDTVTDAAGYFEIGDLPPGKYVVVIDEKTLPYGTMPSAGAVAVGVRAGGTTAGVNFPVVARPREVEVKRFSPSRPALN